MTLITLCDRVNTFHAHTKRLEKIVGGVGAITAGVVGVVGGIVAVLDAVKKPDEADPGATADESASSDTTD